MGLLIRQIFIQSTEIGEVYMTKIYTAGVLLFLSSCTLFPYDETVTYASGYLFGFEGDIVLEEEYEERKFSFLNLKIGRSPSINMVLAYVDDGRQEWRSNDDLRLFTRDGIIEKSVGLNSDIDVKYENAFISLTNPDLRQSPLEIELIKEAPITFNYLGEDVEALYKAYRYNVPSIGWEQIVEVISKDNVPLRTIQQLNPLMPKTN